MRATMIRWSTKLKRTGIDLNQGMVLKLGGQIYHGAECVNMLAMLSTPVGMLNRVNGAVFRSRAASKLLYPVLRRGRSLLLRLLGRTKIGLAGQ